MNGIIKNKSDSNSLMLDFDNHSKSIKDNIHMIYSKKLRKMHLIKVKDNSDAIYGGNISGWMNHGGWSKNGGW